MQTELCMCVVSDSPLFFFLPLKFSFYFQTFLLDIRLLWLWESERRPPPGGVVLETAEKQPAHNETLLSLNNSWGFGDALG